MEKLKKEKHNHKLTDLLKVAIFSMVMLAPIFSVVSKVMYVALNKNAKDSYYGETINEEIINTFDFSNMIAGQQYHFNGININTTNTYQRGTTYIGLKVITEGYDFTNIDYYMGITKSSDYITAYVFSLVPASDTGRYDYNSNTPIEFDFIYNGYVNTTSTDPFENQTIITRTEYNKFSFMDNVFPYAVNELQNDNLYSWAKDTFAYTSINAMCTGLSVQNGVLPLLLSYWTIITAIYIVFDIIIFTFTKLTHLLQD